MDGAQGSNLYRCEDERLETILVSDIGVRGLHWFERFPSHTNRYERECDDLPIRVFIEG
jgi:hypothetical protein